MLLTEFDPALLSGVACHTLILGFVTWLWKWPICAMFWTSVAVSLLSPVFIVNFLQQRKGKKQGLMLPYSVPPRTALLFVGNNIEIIEAYVIKPWLCNLPHITEARCKGGNWAPLFGFREPFWICTEYRSFKAAVLNLWAMTLLLGLYIRYPAYEKTVHSSNGITGMR